MYCLQHDERSDSELTNTPEQPSVPESPAAGTSAQHTGSVTAAEGVNAPVQRNGSLGSEGDDAGLIARPGLGYHPGLGFSSPAAAARFTAVGLDDALEGMLGRDLAAGECYGCWTLLLCAVCCVLHLQHHFEVGCVFVISASSHAVL